MIIHFLYSFILQLQTNLLYMIVQFQDYLHRVIEGSKPHPINSEDNQHFFYKGVQDQLYFKRVHLPEFSFQAKGTHDYIKQVISDFKRLLIFTQQRKSRFILPYKRIVFSYPYACLVHDYFQSTLSDLIKKTSLTYPEKIRLMIQVAKGVKHLHDKRICIRSLQPNSIAVNKSKSKGYFQIVFTDPTTFLCIDEKITPRLKTKNIYMAPEVDISKNNHDFSCDIWSLGLVFCELLFGSKPETVINQISIKEQLKLPKQYPQWLGIFLSQIMKKSSKQRMPLKDILSMLKKADLCSESQTKFFTL